MANWLERGRKLTSGVAMAVAVAPMVHQLAGRAHADPVPYRPPAGSTARGPRGGVETGSAPVPRTAARSPGAGAERDDLLTLREIDPATRGDEVVAWQVVVDCPAGSESYASEVPIHPDILCGHDDTCGSGVLYVGRIGANQIVFDYRSRTNRDRDVPPGNQ